MVHDEAKGFQDKVTRMREERVPGQLRACSAVVHRRSASQRVLYRVQTVLHSMSEYQGSALYVHEGELPVVRCVKSAA
eukprot:3345600-Rhodomonas_salina.1